MLAAYFFLEYIPPCRIFLVSGYSRGIYAVRQLLLPAFVFIHGCGSLLISVRHLLSQEAATTVFCPGILDATYHN